MLRVSAFMHGHGHPYPPKNPHDKIPKTVDEMFKRVRSFIRGEAAAGLAEIARTPQWDKGVTRPKWFEEANRRGRCIGKADPLGEDIRQGNEKNGSQGRGGMKIINMNSLTEAPIILEGTIEGYHVRRIYVGGGSSPEIMYDHYFKSFDANVKSRLRKANTHLV
ncbi:hypothetical protein Tco_0454759 [Tanacetum coccineum]